MAEIMVVELCRIYLGYLVIFNVIDVSSKNVTWVCNDILKAAGDCPAPCVSAYLLRQRFLSLAHIHWCSWIYVRLDDSIL